MGPDGAGARAGTNGGGMSTGGAGTEATGRELAWLLESSPEIWPVTLAASCDVWKSAKAWNANRCSYSAA